LAPPPAAKQKWFQSFLKIHGDGVHITCSSKLFQYYEPNV